MTELAVAPKLAPSPERAFASPPRFRLGRQSLLLTGFGLLALVAAAGVLGWDLPGAPGSAGRDLAVQLRLVSVATIVVVATCQGVGTVLFHTITGNRILTPSIMGFEAIYVVMQTALVFFFGGAMLANTDGLAKIAIQSLLMIGVTTALFTWLFTYRRASLHVTLLIGVVLGIGLGSLSTFMQRLLTPSDFDLLRARLFGNLSNSNPAYLPYAAGLAALLVALVWTRRHHLDVLALGPAVATSLGLNYRREVTGVLIIVSALMSISTALVGPLAFLGFIVATLTYQLSGSGQHRVTLPLVVVLGTAVLLSGYFILRHVFYAAGLLSVIIEFIGGLTFLVFLLRKGVL
ncbi:iron chelate uptake ABC transporter family permease subunit [Scrofimicrobium sp. R131]|uniref:Iron chelate uptake ABC transporter family permease subunit n=1 Tax=Scrofimicrobium appendicitidis TaxID=3079930 RepID=A0AAU7V9I6_9ACTO